MAMMQSLCWQWVRRITLKDKYKGDCFSVSLKKLVFLILGDINKDRQALNLFFPKN